MAKEANECGLLLACQLLAAFLPFSSHMPFPMMNGIPRGFRAENTCKLN
jgi:hypothetical protein